MSITVRNLTKLYGEEKAVNDISFDVRTGEILGFLGPNGAGKTTTMKIITCYMPQSAGTVEVDGLSTLDYSIDVRRRIGYLPELNPLYLDMNVLEYLEYSGRLHGLRAQHLKQRQRVGLAQSMIHDPDVLILDEPTSGLDPNQIVEIRNLIRRLGSAKTVILSPHILSEVQATCDRVIIINEGSIVADGTPDELKQSFRGSESISVELKAETPNAMQDLFPNLKTLQHVETVDYRGSDGPVHKFIIHTLKGTDIREELFRRAVSERWVILELSRQSTSLEEIFHKLTRSDTIN